MDAYPQEYIAHNQPLVILSGFEHVQETCGNDAENYFEHGGVKIGSELPPISGHLAEQLRSEFLKADGSDLPWNGEGHTATPDLLRFKLLSSGRVGTASGVGWPPWLMLIAVSSRTSPFHNGKPRRLQLHRPYLRHRARHLARPLEMTYILRSRHYHQARHCFQTAY